MDDNFLVEIKTQDDIEIPAGMKKRIKCRVKVQCDGLEQNVYFSPSVDENDIDVTLLETVCQLRRGRTNYVYVDVLNESRKDRVLEKGRIIGSVHTVSAVIPMTKFGSVDGDQQEGSDEKEDVLVGCVSEGEGKPVSLSKKSWNLSHLDIKQQAMLEEVLIE